MGVLTYVGMPLILICEYMFLWYSVDYWYIIFYYILMIGEEKNMAKENEDKYTIKMKLSTLTIWMTIAGVVLIIIGTILLNSFSSEFFKKILH